MAGEGGVVPPLRLAVPPSPPPRDPLHLLPCRLRHRGPAPVRSYFQPAIRKNSGGESSVSFRGRSLKGIQVSVPEGYVGLVLEKDEAPLLELEERQLRVKSAFESLTVWNLEEAPKSTDEIMMALHWPKIAEGIHATVAD
ncbi:ribonuclease H2 subunit C isoform X2 [Sceloporus undulatus]|uniref:ribonuclease H2 subunit C isoform X2 n=1 Tax=Sceloporus undulatus TaxID=8520 RepID=UPI001C4B77BB|nr:ribonuclease H2 subunit C isoform X2 [Sceloporus undulatus]